MNKKINLLLFAFLCVFPVPSFAGNQIKGFMEMGLYDLVPLFFQEYGIGIIVCILLLILIVLLLILLRRNKQFHYERSNQEMKFLLESMPDMAVIFNSEYKIIDIINPMPDFLFDQTKEQFIGHSMDELQFMIPGFSNITKNIGEHIKFAFDSKEIRTFNYDFMLKGKISYSEIKTVPFGKDKIICFVHNITSRVFAEKEVIKYKNFLTSIIDNLPVGVFVKDVSNDFRYIYYNQKVADFDQENAEFFLGKNDFEANDPLAVEFREQDEAVLCSEVPITYESADEDKMGNLCHVITTKKRLINDDGSRYIIAILVDVSKIRRNEIELENIRRQLSVALDAGSLSAWIYDVKRRSFTSLYGETLVREGVGYIEEDIIHPNDREKYRSFVSDLVAGKCEKKKEILRAFRNGEYAWYEIQAIAIHSDEGKIFQIVGTEKDITEEIHRQRKLEADKFKTELAIMSNGIVQWDYDVVNKIFSSPNHNSFMHEGLSKEKFLSIVYPEDVHLLLETLDKMINGEEESLNIQIRVWLPEKGFRWVDIHSVVFRKDEQGRVVELTGLRCDITDWRNLTDELIMLRDKAEESNRLKTAFLANMSHEIRTPLNAIVGFSNLITQTEDQQEIREYSNIIEINNQLLLQLVNDILDLSKIEAGQLDFIFSDIRVFSLLENLEQIYRFRVKEGVQLICDLPDEDCIICSEKNRLTQVISNFLSNACKFTSQGYIKIGFERIIGGLRFFVTDTGTGIPKENIPLVFDRFTKFDSFVQGTGLGLSICQTIVSRLGGEIGVESEPGKGSTFWFSIPCEISQQDTSLLRSDVCPVEKQKIASGKKCKLILVAEDNDSNYLLLLSILRKDYRLERALNGLEAVRLSAELHPDLIFMDIRMPVMDGLEATACIRETDLETPIIALTANAFDEDRAKSLQAGCNDYLSKPVEMKNLKALLSKYF